MSTDEATSPNTTVRYRKSSAVTEFKEFAGRSHFIPGQEGWQEFADDALDWATAHTAPVAPTPAEAR